MIKQSLYDKKIPDLFKVKDFLETYNMNEPYDEKWDIETSVEERNQVDILWDELQILLEDDKDFQISYIWEDSIFIKAINPMAFIKEYIYYNILSPLIPMDCKLELASSYFQADVPEKDRFTFNFSITTEENLYYKGNIYITK